MRIVGLLLLFLALPAYAARLSAELGANYPSGGSFRMTFTCEFAGGGTSGPCVGTYHDVEKFPECHAPVSHSNALTLNGFNASQAGGFSATLFLQGIDVDIDGHAGVCTASSGDDVTVALTGSWDGARGSFSIQDTDFGVPYTIHGTIKLEGDPVFPMTVTNTITPTVASSQATFQPRPQDAGTTQGIYVFALAPAPRVLGVTAATMKAGTAKATGRLKTDPVPCVLAQLNSQGQLVGVSASTLQAYATGVLDAQGNAVTVLNAVSTPNVAGATMFIGYGTSSANMIASGVNRSVVTVPGTVECRPEGPQTGWWWNTSEGGRGYSIEKQGANLFYAAYFYDASGRATWLVASGPTTLEGALFTAPLYACTGGVTLSGAYRANNCSPQGEVTLAFNTPTTGTMLWPGGTVGIERFNIVTGGIAIPPVASQPENGWWWSSAENGRGFFIEWQGATADIAGYMYDDAGNPIWYITVAQTPDMGAIANTWWQFADGQTQSGAYRPATRISDNVAPLTIQFSSATAATLTLPGGRQVALTRFRF